MTTQQILELAEKVLTRKQYDVLRLHLNDMGTTRIARALDISEPTAREHLRIAKLRLRQALEQENAA